MLTNAILSSSIILQFHNKHLPAKNVEKTCSGVRNRTVERLCPHRLALVGVVLAEGAVEFAGCGHELIANVAANNRNASNDEKDWEDPEELLVLEAVTVGGLRLTWGQQWS